MRERSSKIRFLFYAILFLAMAISLAIPMQAALAVAGPAVVWVDGTSTCTGHALGTDCFATIQEGIDAVVSSGTVNVGAGTYAGFTANKPLTLLGAQHDVDPAGALYRGAADDSDESVISGTITITADDVVLNGFKTSSPINVGYDSALRAVINYNISENADGTWGAIHFHGTGGGPIYHQVDGGYIGYNNISGTTGNGIWTVGNDNVTIEYNHVLNVTGAAIEAINHVGTGIVISNNTITNPGGKGINYWAGNGATICGNIITNTGNEGIYLSSGHVDDLVCNNVIENSGRFPILAATRAVIDGNTVSNSTDGIRIDYAGTSTSDRVEVTDNTVSYIKYAGINVTGAYAYVYGNTVHNSNYFGSDGLGDWDYASIHMDPSATNSIIDGNNVYDGVNGIQTWANDVTITNNTIYDMGVTYGNEKIVDLRTYKNSAIIVGSNWGAGDIDPTGVVIQHNALHDNYYGLFYSTDLTNGVTAESNWWGDASGPGVVGPGTGDKVTTNVDYSPWWGANYIGVAHPWSWYTNDTIQNAIDIATAGDTINVCAGTYAGEIKIDRSVTILGDPGDTAPGPGAFAPVIDGGSAPGDAFLIKNGVSNVTIQGFEVRNFTSDDTGIGNAISAWVGSTSNITVQDNYFHDLEYNGVLVGNDYNADPAKWGDHTGWTIKGNILDNVGYIGFELTNTSNSSIEDNIIHMDEPIIGAVFSSARRSESGLTVKNNLIDGIPSTLYPVIYMYAYDLDMPNPNLDSVLIEGNTIDCLAGTPYQVYIRNIGTGTITGVQVLNNSFLRLKNLTSETIDASSNYWGGSDPTTVAANISGTVDFSPLLNSGTDTDLATLGFQPDFSSYTVHTLGSQTGATSLIQEGINLVNGSTLNVVAGTYVENINIDKSLNLLGAQAGVGVAGRNAGDAAEATIQGLVSVNASGVSINGFTLTNPGQTSAITIPPSSSNTDITYNMIDNVGAPTLSSNVHSIVFQNGADSVNISHNSFNNINANAKSASAISVLDSVSTDPSNDLVINDNTFTNIVSVTKGAYGIIINNKAGAPGAEITFNTFSGLNGNWTHAIGLETDIINPVVASNNFSNLTVNVGSDVAAIFFEADPSSHTAKIMKNRFEGTTFYGVLIHPDSVTLGYTANAVKNWWGDASGPGLVGDGTGALVGTNVDYTPWCTDMDCTSVYNLVTGNVTASDGTFTNKVMVTWDNYRGATIYILYRGTTGIAGDATELVRRNGTAYADRTATPGVTYYYWVKGCYFADCSDFSNNDTGWMGMSPPTDLQASDGTFSDKVQITWTAAPGSTSYEVYRSELNGLIKTLLDSPVGTAFDDTTATPGVNYKYWVKSCIGTICSDFGHFERGWRNLPAPENLVASDGTFVNKVLVSWDASSEAFYYIVYRGTTAIVGDAVELRRTKGTQIADVSALPGVTYHYWVKAFTRRGLGSDYSNSDTGWR